MRPMNQLWKDISKKQKIQVVIAASLTLLLTVQLPVMAWFRKKREAARFERINAPNTLFVTAAHREDSKYLVMDDITVDGKWTYSNGNEYGTMKYQDYVFAVAGDYVESFTLQLAHTTNNPYTYEIFEAEAKTNTPGDNEIKGKDYVTYKVTNEWPPELTAIPDNDGTVKENESILYYYIKKTNEKPITLNQTVKTDDGNAALEVNTCSYSDSTVSYNGHYLNMGNDGKATDRYINLTYGSYEYYDQRVQPLYWQCTNIPGSNGVNKNAFYREYILRVYFNNATTTYKDTDVVYITAIGNN